MEEKIVNDLFSLFKMRHFQKTQKRSWYDFCLILNNVREKALQSYVLTVKIADYLGKTYCF